MKIDESLFRELLDRAAQSERKRSHRNLHRDYSEAVQRLCIGLVRGTYIRPHCHQRTGKGELILGVQGSAALVTFDDSGRILERTVLGPGDTASGAEMSPDVWHTIYPIGESAVILEVKEGPYTPTEEEDFASWAPKEGEHEVARFLGWVERAPVGDRFVGDD